MTAEEWDIVDFDDDDRPFYRKLRPEEIRRRMAKRAHQKVGLAVRRGKLKKPGECSSCLLSYHSNDIHAHHEDYTKPLSVVWLCASCHARLHWMEARRADRSAADANRVRSGP